MTKLNSKVPKGPIKDKWTTYKDKIDLVNPANKRNIDIIVVGTGLGRRFCSGYFGRIRL